MIASLLPVNDWRFSISCEFRFNSCMDLESVWVADCAIDGDRRAMLAIMTCAAEGRDWRAFEVGIGAIARITLLRLSLVSSLSSWLLLIEMVCVDGWS